MEKQSRLDNRKNGGVCQGRMAFPKRRDKMFRKTGKAGQGGFLLNFKEKRKRREGVSCNPPVLRSLVVTNYLFVVTGILG